MTASAATTVRVATTFIPGRPRIAVDQAGEGPLVVMLHGIGGNRTNWTEQLLALADEGFTAVAWDARGYGASEDYEGPLDFGDFSADLLRLLDHYATEKAHVVGLSMGGRIAQDFYHRNPGRVATLALCDTFIGYDQSFTPEKREEFLRLRQKPLLEGKEPADIAPQVAATLVSPGCPEPKYQRLVDSLSALRKEMYLKTLATTIRYDVQGRPADIKVPTVVIFGADDRLTTPEIGRKLASEIDGAEYRELPNAGHLSNIEQPDAFNRALVGFLARHRERATMRRPVGV